MAATPAPEDNLPEDDGLSNVSLTTPVTEFLALLGGPYDTNFTAAVEGLADNVEELLEVDEKPLDEALKGQGQKPGKINLFKKKLKAMANVRNMTWPPIG